MSLREQLPRPCPAGCAGGLVWDPVLEEHMTCRVCDGEGVLPPETGPRVVTEDDGEPD